MTLHTEQEMEEEFDRETQFIVKDNYITREIIKYFIERDGEPMNEKDIDIINPKTHKKYSLPYIRGVLFGLTMERNTRDDYLFNEEEGNNFTLNRNFTIKYQDRKGNLSY